MAPFQSVVAPIPEMPRQSTATVVVEEETEELVAAARDSEWEQVTEQDRTSAPEAHGRYPSPWRGRIGRTRQYGRRVHDVVIVHSAQYTGHTLLLIKYRSVV
uniref:Uncharacterized protein n=1 Tax=Hyaloperonospora arabidopsidis (strain Emoy2) TaxID=559515 RepID=M4BGS3_HYAAE